MLYRCEHCGEELRADSTPAKWTPAWKPFTSTHEGERPRTFTYTVVWRCPKHPVRKEQNPASITAHSQPNPTLF